MRRVLESRLHLGAPWAPDGGHTRCACPSCREIYAAISGDAGRGLVAELERQLKDAKTSSEYRKLVSQLAAARAEVADLAAIPDAAGFASRQVAALIDAVQGLMVATEEEPPPMTSRVLHAFNAVRQAMDDLGHGR